MELNFDIRGNLKPYRNIAIDYGDFKSFFVDYFDVDSFRYELFQNYERYTQDFTETISPNFKQWINGSFATNKRNPKDIDLVNLIDYRIVAEKEPLIRNNFIRDSVYKSYGIDAYLVILYPKSHKLHSWTESDLLYWNDWFTKSEMDRQRKRHPKGYVEIKFGELNS